MRLASCAAFLILASLSAMAAQPDAPGPLLKPVIPPKTSIRVRIPVIEQRNTTMQFKALIAKGPKAKGKKGETIEVMVGVETLPGKSYVSTKLWKDWGYDVPPNKLTTLAELIVLGTQLAPKSTKGLDVQVKVPDINLEIIDPPGGADKVRGVDIYIRLGDLTKNADRQFEPRLNFQDRFLDLTVPATAVKRPGTGDEPPAEPTITSDQELVVVAGPMVINKGLPIFAYASVNGLTQYKTADGQFEAVRAGVSSTSDTDTGVWITMGTARGCNVEMDQGKDIAGKSATFETRVVKGKVKELRLGVMTGPGLKIQKDIVIQDIVVFVDKADSGHFVYLGPRFMDTYLKDSVYACGPEGLWQLHGRLKPELLQDIKTRAKK